MANLPKQWGCDRMSTVRYDTSTKKAASPFTYFPSIKDNELDFGFNLSGFKSLNPKIKLGEGFEVSLFTILGQGSSLRADRGTDLALNYRNAMKQDISQLVHNHYQRKYSSENVRLPKAMILGEAITAQNIVDGILRKRMDILKKVISKFMDAMEDDFSGVRIVGVPGFRIPYKLRVYKHQVGSASYGDGVSHNDYSRTLGITLGRLTDQQSQSIRRGLAKFKSMYNPQGVQFASPTSSCSAGLNNNKLVDFLVAGVYPAFVKPIRIQMQGRTVSRDFYAQYPNAAKLSTSLAGSSAKSFAQSRDQKLTIGLLNTLTDVIARYPQEIGTGNLTFRVLRAQLSGSNLQRVFNFLSSSSLNTSTVSVKGLAGKKAQGQCADVQIQHLLSALMLIDFMNRKSTNTANQLDVFLTEYLTRWLPDRLAAVLSPTQQVVSSRTGTQFTGPIGQQQEFIPPIFMPGQTQIRPGMRFLSPGDLIQAPSTEVTAGEDIVGEEVYYEEDVLPIPADGVDEEFYYEEYTEPTDEAIPFFDGEGESELTHTPAEGETPAEEDKPAEEEKKKSYTPYIVGGVVLLGAIGTYVYMNRDK